MSNCCGRSVHDVTCRSICWVAGPRRSQHYVRECVVPDEGMAHVQPPFAGACWCDALDQQPVNRHMTCTQNHRPVPNNQSSWLMLCPHWSGAHVSRIGATSYVRTSTGERQCRLTHSLPEGNSAVSARCRSESHGRLPTKLRTCRCSNTVEPQEGCPVRVRSIQERIKKQ